MLNYFFSKTLYLIGNRIRFNKYNYEIPFDRPLILVSNHQSMFDISPIAWHFRKHHVKYISKKELAKGIPSISFNLKHSDSISIDRKNTIESQNKIKTLSYVLKKYNNAVIIFPEGTRSRNGKMGGFKKKGLKTMLEIIPDATLLPITINNSWKIFKFGAFPLGLFNTITFHVHKPLFLTDFQGMDCLIDEARDIIKSKVK